MACLGVALAAVAGCGSLRQIGAGEHTPPPRGYTVGGRVATVIVNGGGGSIDVTGSARQTIAVSERASYSKTAPVTRHTVSGSTLTLSYRCASQLICGVSYTLRVPSGVTVRAHAGAGAITLTALAGPVTAATSAGLITAVALRSPTASFSSNAGGVVATFSAAPRAVTATTNLGPITLTVPGTVAYQVSTRTYVGTSKVTVRESASSPHSITARSYVGTVSVSPS